MEEQLLPTVQTVGKTGTFEALSLNEEDCADTRWNLRGKSRRLRTEVCISVSFQDEYWWKSGSWVEWVGSVQRIWFI